MLPKPIPITEHSLKHKTNKLVSISCVTYNHEGFIRDTLEGFLMQKTTFSVKIVIFEDCSSDNTASIIREYQEKHPYLFEVFFQSENTWGKPVRKEAFEPYFKAHKDSEYIALCEGDDYWTDPFKLQKQVDFLEQNKDYGLVYTEIDRIDESGKILDKKYFKNESNSFSHSFEDYLVYAPFRAPCTWLYRRSLYQKREKMYNVGDLPLLLDILAKSKIHFLDEVTANYRVLTNSASHFTDLSKLYSFMKGIFEIQMDYAYKYNVSEDIIDKIQTNFAWLSYNFAVAENDKEQIKAANKILIKHPELSYKFKVVKLLGKTRLGRFLYRKRLIQRLGYVR